jgi:Polyketide cyclase / dehydrase and lipid transport
VVTVRVSIEVPAGREQVWSELARIEDHVEWMLDATAIRFRGEQHEGVGTLFECDTKIGLLRLTDVMEITEWEPGEAIGVKHAGPVGGTGRFSLRDAAGGTTNIEWNEELLFPWWLGAAAGAQLARPVFTALWKGNLRRLSHRIGVTT